METQRLASMGARQVAFGNFQTALMSFNFRCKLPHWAVLGQVLNTKSRT
ncbi:hypothetical protein ACO2IY_08175 [Leptospira interrogans]|nr:hypothetical protein [Leptospira interrogans]